MAGRDVAYRGSLLMNIVEVCHLDVASFGQWDDPKAEVYTGAARRPLRSTASCSSTAAGSPAR